MVEELNLKLQDLEYEWRGFKTVRNIARAIVFDEKGYFYFVQVKRNDIFGNATYIETSGGGIEENEDLIQAVKRELKEELGADIEVITKIGVVEDYYNLLYRKNINHYFLCKVIKFGDKHLMEDEINCFHLKTVKFFFGEAKAEYEKCRNTKIGRILCNRELPVLLKAQEIINEKKILN